MRVEYVDKECGKEVVNENIRYVKMINGCLVMVGDQGVVGVPVEIINIKYLNIIE